MRHIASKVCVLLLFSFTILFVIYAQQVNAASFQLNWTDNSQDEDGFSIERKLDTNGIYAVIAAVGPNVTSYSDSSLANSTTYCYRVNAFNSAGNSEYTNEACGIPPATTPPPEPPTSGDTITPNVADGAVLSAPSTQLAGCTNGVVTMDATNACTATFQTALQPIAKIGIFRPETGEWFLDKNGNGQWDGCGVDKCFGPFGGNGYLPIVGDWSGTGQVGIGVFYPETGEWFLDKNGSGQWDGCAIDACLGPFGYAGELPVVGKW